MNKYMTKDTKCTTGTSKLFPASQCENQPTKFLFGDPYCDTCYTELVRLHGIINK